MTDTFDIDDKNISPANISEKLREKYISESTIDELLQIFGKLRQYRFSNNSQIFDISLIQNKVKDIYVASVSNATKPIIQMANKFLKEGQNIRIVELNDKDPSIIGFSKMQELIQHSAITSFYDIISMKLSL